MEIDVESIKQFVKKQNMDWRDKWVQMDVIQEEVSEMREAEEWNRIGEVKQETADVVIAAFVFAELSGFLDELPELIAEKMQENLQKPVRNRHGEKVKKRW